MPAKISEEPPRVSNTEARRFVVHHGWAWAHIFVSHGVRHREPMAYEWHTQEDLEITWVSVSANSDYGCYGFVWSHCGHQVAWSDFLARIGFDYAMNKMAGDRFRTWKRGADLANQAKRLVLDVRRQNGCTKDEARELWDDIPDPDHYPGPAFYTEWERSNSDVYRFEFYESDWEEVNPQVQGFWDKCWIPFVDQLSST
jgi:hypothetical protein